MRLAGRLGRSLIGLVPLVAFCAPAFAQQRPFDVPSAEAARVLPEFARQAGIQIIAPGRHLRGIVLPEIKGTFDVREALRTLLAGTRLDIVSDSQDIIVLRPSFRKTAKISDVAVRPGNRPATRDEGEMLRDTDIGEIAITASRRSETLRRVPMSVTAFSADDLEMKAVRSIDDIVRATPGVNLARTFANNNSLSVRGVASSGANTTGIYIDDTPIQARTLGVGSYNGYPLIFDLDRVEVLRGPQGTLFGAGSMGGTIRFITPTPSLVDTTTTARFEVSNVEHGAMSYEAGIAHGVPLAEGKIGARLSAWIQRTGGYVDRVDPTSREVTARNVNSGDAKMLRADVRFALSDRLTATPSFYFQEIERGDLGQYWEEYSDPRAGDFRTAIVTPQPTTDRFRLPSLKLQFEADTFDVFSNTSYFDRFERSTYDYSTLIPAYFVLTHFDPRFPNYKAAALFINRQRVLTHETRVQSAHTQSDVQWIAGVFLNSSKQSAYEHITDPDFPRLIDTVYGQTVAERFGMGMLSGDRIFIQDDVARDRQYAVFGEVSYTVFDKMTLSAGGRYAHMSFELDNYGTGPFNGGTTTAVDGTTNDKGFSPKFGISWQSDDDALYYVTVAKGFRAGGVNQPIPYAEGLCKEDLDRILGGPASPTYRSDSIWSYEAGSKRSFLDGRLYAAMSAYYLEWDDLQQGRTVCGLNFIDNSGAASSKGFDLALTFRPSIDVTLGLAVGYADANYTNTIFGAPNPATGARAITVAKGNGLLVQPWTVTANAQHYVDLFGQAGYVRVDYEHRGGFNMSAALDPRTAVYNSSGLEPQPTHFFTARLGAYINAWDVSLFVKNLTDSSTQLSRFVDRITVKGLRKGRTFQPRSIGVTATARY